MTVRGASIATLSVLVLAACALEVEAPRWERLAIGAEPRPVEALLASWNGAEEGLSFRVAEGGNGVWVERALPQEWRQDPKNGRWRLSLPEQPAIEPGDRVELSLDGVRMTLPAREGDGPRALIHGSELVLQLAQGDRAPREATVSFLAERSAGGRSAENVDGRSRIEDGLVVWPGERVELVRDLPARSVLRFQPRLRRFASRGGVSFRVWLDDALAYESSVDVASGETLGPALIVLGEEARPGVRLAFEVSGVPAATSFARPVLGPAEVGRPGARPWRDSRQDVILFLADTFRADLLAAYGGDPALTPALNALAARSVVFREARSTSTWTLPAHGSLFTGTWPPQHGAEDMESALSGELDTLAEFFARAGYRSVAVTDGLYVTRAFGMDQGFESFEVQQYTGEPRLASTLETARELVGADDGRPLFLFVQTYRTHWPYGRGPEEDDRRAKEVRNDATERVKAALDDEERQSVLGSAARELHALYREGASALDAEFGPWFRELEERGLFERGVFVFTSDHGEAFLEHDEKWHGGVPYEELARVPLFFFHVGEAPREVGFGASLIDLPPTLAEFCGLEPLVVWQGRDLFTLQEERVLYSCVKERAKHHLGVVSGPHKLLATSTAPLRLPEDLFAAYALDLDRGERVNLLGTETWVEELTRAALPGWRALQAPLTEGTRVELDEQQADELRRLGYAGEED